MLLPFTFADSDRNTLLYCSSYSHIAVTVPCGIVLFILTDSNGYTLWYCVVYINR